MPNSASGLGYVGLLLAAFLGSLTAFLGLWAKLWIDEWSARSDEIVEIIIELADKSTDYWSTSFDNDPNKQSAAEAVIIGKNALMHLLMVPIMKRLPSIYKNDLYQPMADFSNAVTGGEFSDRGRSPDLHRARDCQAAAASAVLALRISHRRSIRLRTRFSRGIGYHG